jgi:hypothetical protein
VEVTRAHFGGYVSIYPDKAGSFVFSHASKCWYIEDPTREAAYGDYDYKPPPPPEQGPFTRADFGELDRFSWAAGACSMAQNIQASYWGSRYAIWMKGSVFFVIDATRPVILQLALPGIEEPASYRPMMFHGGRLWIESQPTVTWIALPDLEAMFDRAPGTIEVVRRELYPCRRPDVVIEARMEDVGRVEARARILDVTERSLRIPTVPGVAVGMVVTLSDALADDVYLEITLPGQPKQPLRAPLPTSGRLTATLSFEPAIDPASELAVPAAPTEVRQAELDRLFAALADDPDDDATRFVIVDLLEAAGEPYAHRLQTLISGETDDELRREGLGTLASYLQHVEYRGGLPCAATLASAAPLDPDIGDRVAADQRLGFFRDLRLGDGHYNVYAKLVGSPRAVGLRTVEASRANIVAALIAGGRRDLTWLVNVKFATREVIDGLADSTFDRVRGIHTQTAIASVAKLLEFVIRDETQFFTRTPRHLLLEERTNRDHVLVPEVLAAWDRLPLDKVTVAGITLGRDGIAHASASAPANALDLVRARFKIELKQ